MGYAGVLSYESFNYSDSLNIVDQNGGSGWSGPWYTNYNDQGYIHRGDPGNVTSSSLPQSAVGGSLLTTAGYAGPGSIYVARNTADQYAGPGNTVWGSFTYTDTVTGSPLQLNLQQAGVATLIAYNLPNGSFPFNDLHDTAGNFCLFDVVGSASTCTANFYINPNLSTFNPSTTTPTYSVTSGTETNGFNAINFGLFNDAGANQDSIDEIRFGTTVQDVANVVVATGPASLTWNNAGGNNTWDISTTSNWSNAGSNTIYRDSSNTAASPVTGDKVTFDDSISANPGNYNVTIAGNVHPTSVTFANSVGNYNISGTGVGITGATSVTLTGTGVVTLASSNTYTGGTNVSAGTLQLASGTAFPSNTALTVASGATARIANSSGNTSYVVTVSSLSNSGVVDITNNAMVLKNANASIGTINTEVAIAYNEGAWNGTNASSGVITSTAAQGDTTHLTAIGIATGLTSFQGAGGIVAVNPADVIVKYTYYGDANLDGIVDGSDYTRIDNAYLQPLTGWQNGDFNYDGVVNGSDYTLIDNAFNTQGVQRTAEIAATTTQIAGSGFASSVPEPTSLGLLATGAFGLLGRRRAR